MTKEIEDKQDKQKKFRKFRRSKKSKKHEFEQEEIMEDPREPEVKFPLIIVKYFLPEVFIILLGLLGCGILGATPIVMYKVLGGLMDGLSGGSSAVASKSAYVTTASALIKSASFKVTVNNAALYMTYVAIASLVGGFINQCFLNLARDRIGNKLKVAFFNALLDQEIGYFDIKRTGQLISDMTDTELIQEGYTTKLGEIVKGLIQAILGVAIALDAGWKMSLVMLSTTPLLIFILLVSGSMIRYFVGKTNQKISGAAAVANEVISAMRTVRSMDGEEKEKVRYSRELRKAHPWFIWKATSMGLSLGFAMFVIWATIALAFWFGGKLIVSKEITIGEMFQVFGLGMIAVIGFLTALQFVPDLQKADPAIRTILKLVTREPALRVEGGITPNKIVGHVEFKNVNFRYPTRPNVQVLKDFSLDILPGQAVALVGASGSGKSTIVGLLERFYSAESGQIILDGTNLEDIDPRWLHRNIGIVTQEPTLFAGTIKENIKYAIEGVREVTDEEVYKAAEAANAHDFITALPNGYETMMGERGVSLSGGQKQRVAIARAMIQNPSLLLLDEATSALDTQSESIVQDALTKLMKGRTSIVIAHRLTTIVDSDVIVVMHKGEMKEKGTHQELMNIPDGYYARLAKKQMMRH